MMIDCREDPCGECRYCRFEAEPREAELPTDGVPLPSLTHVLPPADGHTS